MQMQTEAVEPEHVKDVSFKIKLHSPWSSFKRFTEKLFCYKMKSVQEAEKNNNPVQTAHSQKLLCSLGSIA